MRRLGFIALPLVVVAVTASVSYALIATKPELETSPESPRPRVVTVAPVAERDTVLTVHSQGEVTAGIDTDLVAQVSGKVVYVSPEFTEGGIFDAEDVLLKIEDSDYRVAVKNAEAEVARAKVAVDQGAADAEVARQQLAGVKASALGLKKPQLAQAKASLVAAEAELQQAKLNLARTQVHLPYRGRVREDRVGLGQYVTAGTVLASAFSTDRVEVRLPLTDQQLATLGLPIGFSSAYEDAPDVELSGVIAGQQRLWAAKLIRVDPAIDPLSRVIYAVAQMRDPYGEPTYVASGAPLAVGLYVKAAITGQIVSQAKTIPRTALRAGNRVYLVKDGVLMIREVQVQHTDDDIAIIDSGVTVGDQVVTSPVRDPINGLRVETQIQGLARNPEQQQEDRS